MTFNVNWGDTPIYKKHMADKPDERFTDEHGVPPFPINCVMWPMGAIGISQITEDNASDVFARLQVLFEVTSTAFARKFDGDELVDVDLEPSHIAQCVGLGVNVSRMTNSEYVKHVLDIAKREKCEVDRQDVTRRIKEAKAFFNQTALNSLITK